MYYLQSRYYNADWDRFINANAARGSIGGLLSHNMSARVDRPHVFGDQNHVHILKKGKEIVNQNEDGTPHHENDSIISSTTLVDNTSKCYITIK